MSTRNIIYECGLLVGALVGVVVAEHEVASIKDDDTMATAIRHAATAGINMVPYALVVNYFLKK